MTTTDHITLEAAADIRRIPTRQDGEPVMNWGAAVPMEDPLQLLGRLKLGREEYCQRLLTMLILNGPYPKWNRSSTPSAAGSRFLEQLDALSFDSGMGPQPAVFVDEFDLPRRHELEKGCGPDWAMLWHDRLWIVELKTETGSHVPAQVPAYLEFARHYYPDLRIDLTYLTPAMVVSEPPLAGSSRFGQVTWDQVIGPIQDIWAAEDDAHSRTVQVLVAALQSIGTPWPSWRSDLLASARVATPERPPAVPFDPVAAAVALAEATSIDGQQRGLNWHAGSLEKLQAGRLSVREAISSAQASVGMESNAAMRRVLPWLWDETTSGGQALTEAGAETGYELRLSRYESPVY